MTSESGKQFLLSSSKLAEGAFREACLERDDNPLWLVITRQQGTPRAWLNVCPHAGRALNWGPDKFLTDESGRLVCAAHGAVFEPADGACISGPCQGAALRAFDVVEEDGEIRCAVAD
ncbi:MAG TPA: Rieske (2Fe-2S) protein [Wenzhouxiangellaceae bacterium]|nr:Rieske (2Fe-2S) protein [Wenzhouxiangellaceae bacterium]